MIKRQRIHITGTVQGVGFRPAVYAICVDLGRSGFVYNDTKGVTIEIQGDQKQISEFLTALKSGPGRPVMAKIKNTDTKDIAVITDEEEFVINKSKTIGSILSDVTADIALCHDCLKELNDATDYHYRYPFINCTNCGPRYSIIKSIPYDRPNTTMSEFEMCAPCFDQYNDPANRRFHAQPVACHKCGPKIWLTNPDGLTITADNEQAISATAQMLRDGKIVAIKGIGGFHLAVNALND